MITLPRLLALLLCLSFIRLGICQSLQSDPPLHVAVAGLQWDGSSEVSVESQHRDGIPQALSERPAYVEMNAELANFDHDWAADGWRAEMVIRRGDHQIITPMASATFELWPASPTADRPIGRWMVPLRFDSQGIARVHLPSETVYQGLRGSYGTSTRKNRQPIAVSFIGDTRHPVLVTSPRKGVLWAKVMLESGISLEAADWVTAVPSTLVDIGGNVR